MLLVKVTGSGKGTVSLAPVGAATGKINAIPIIIVIRCLLATLILPIAISQCQAYFRMRRADRNLLLALGLSLAVHLLPVLSDLIAPTPAPPIPAPPPLNVKLEPPAPDTPATQAPLFLPEPAEPAAAPARKLPDRSGQKPADKPVVKPATWNQTVRKHLQELNAQGQFYPAEAIALGLQGEALVLLVLDENGKVVAARIEESSGHPMLDEAALRAARSLHSEAADTPRQTYLPIRFRLR
jgi:periplasmic protein TonB